MVYFQNKHGSNFYHGSSEDTYRYHKWYLTQGKQAHRTSLNFGFVTGHQESWYLCTSELQKAQLNLANLKN